MDHEKLLDLYRLMFKLRRFDELCMRLKMEDLIYSGYHPYYGQEAVAAGFCSPLGEEDTIVSTHRAHCHAVAKGASIRSILSEMMGRQAGVSGGLGGAMQFIDTENNFYCGSIVGSGTAIAVGMAMAMKQMTSNRICLCIFGDGASNTGTFHESLNLAAIWKLPVIYLCENNQYAEAMPAREFVASQRISDRAQSYGLESITIDGNDIEQTYATATRIIAKTRSGGGPVLIEALTYRIRGHYVGDPEQTYRTKAEVNEWKARCPVQKCRKRLLGIGIDHTQLDTLEKEIIREIEVEQNWVTAQPFATLEQAIAHVMIPLEKKRH